jgi:hypothetical protein
MRKALLMFALVGTALPGLLVLARQQATRVNLTASAAPLSTTMSPKPNFETDIKPIFQAKCQPCHFQGGQVYDKMPFDKAETITRLGTKLFTRIKDEKEQRLIREFLDQP